MPAEQSEAGPDEHLALERLDPVDVSFDDAGDPGEGEFGDDGVEVAFEVGCEVVQGGQVIVMNWAIEAGRRTGCLPEGTGTGPVRRASASRCSGSASNIPRSRSPGLTPSRRTAPPPGLHCSAAG